MKKLQYDDVAEVIYKQQLDNGLTLFLLPKQHVAKTFAIFMTNYGSMDNQFVPINGKEPIRVPDGIAHFLEHKLFEKEDGDVFSEFSKLGASANAYTSFSKTAYLFSTTENIEQNLLTLLDFVQDPYFSDETVEKEKGIITQEILMYQDQPDWVSYMGTIKNMYHELPIRIDIAGTVDSIQQITKEDLYTCYETFYHPSNMVLFVIGNFSAEQLQQLIETNQQKKQFTKQRKIERFYPEEPKNVVTKSKMIHMPVSLPKVTIGIKSPANFASSDELLETELLQQMVLDHFFSSSGSMYKLLNDEQLIDESFEYSTTVENAFNFSLISGNTTNPEKFSSTIRELLLQMKNTKISEQQFMTMKKMKIGQMLRSMNSLEHIANQYIHYYFQQIDYLQFIPFIQQLSIDKLQSFLEHWITEECMTTLTIQKE